MPTKAEHPRARLRHFMDARAKELGLTKQDVADRAGVTTSYLRRVRNDLSRDVTMTPNLARGIEQALDWKAGSVNEVLRGGEPEEATESQMSHSLASVLQHWSTRLRPSDYAKLAQDLVTIRMEAYEEGRIRGRTEGDEAGQKHV